MIINRDVPYFLFLSFCALMQGTYSWCAKNIRIEQVGEILFIPVLSVLAESCRSRIGTTGFSLKLPCPHFLRIPLLLPTQVITPSACVTGIFSKRQMHRPSRHSVWLTRASHCSWKKQDSFTFAAKIIFRVYSNNFF